MMSIHILYALPELFLLIGMAHLYVMRLWGEDAAKPFARTARFWLLASLFCHIIFYDKSIYPAFWNNNAYTLLFKFPAYFFAYLLLGTTPIWFATEKKTGCGDNILLLASLFMMNIMLASTHLIILAVSYALTNGIAHFLYKKENELSTSKLLPKSLTLAAVFLLLAATAYLFFFADGKLDYHSLHALFVEKQLSLACYLSACAIIAAFLYSLGIVPFHLAAEDYAGKNTLPASHYFAIIYPLFFWGTFIKLNILLFSPFATNLTTVYMLFAVLSIIFGAVGANTRINLYRIFTFISMYHFGVILLLLAFFNNAAEYSAYIYLLTYLLGLNGIYLVFYNLKSRNMYLSTLDSLSGIAGKKAYSTGVLFLSLFSLAGIPPLAGFLGQIEVIYQFIALGHPAYLGIIFLFFLLLIKVLLEIIKTAFAEQELIIYDAENKFICFFMTLNALILFAATFNPFNWIEIFKDMFYVIFI